MSDNSQVMTTLSKKASKSNSKKKAARYVVVPCGYGYTLPQRFRIFDKQDNVNLQDFFPAYERQAAVNYAERLNAGQPTKGIDSEFNCPECGQERRNSMCSYCWVLFNVPNGHKVNA